MAGNLVKLVYVGRFKPDDGLKFARIINEIYEPSELELIVF